MNFTKLLLVVVMLAAVLLFGSAEAGKLKKIGKKVEKTGKHVANAAQKAGPVVAGVAALV
ncbi:AAEL017211-PA [Aedes aegypti]|uniref:AAEL017211-PA n=1 Tax=Aedes aegypti TaxID=7159 RepID=J9HSD6_AEDAE|nr:AAEL017211-PA [Aedes aegypti]